MKTATQGEWIKNTISFIALTACTFLTLYGYFFENTLLLILSIFILTISLLNSNFFRSSYITSWGLALLIACAGIILAINGNNALTFETLLYLVVALILYWALIPSTLRRNKAILKRQKLQQLPLSVSDDAEFNRLANNIPILIWTATPEGTIDYISDQISRFCGLPKETILGDWLSVLHPDDRQHTVACWQAAQNKKQTYETEYRIKRFDGAYIWHSIQGRPVLDENGKVLKWYGSSVDIENVKVLQRKGESLAKKLNITIESITDAFFTLDEQFKITYINHRAAAIFNKDPDSLLGTTIWSNNAIVQDDAFSMKFKEALQHQQSLRFQEFLVANQRWLEVSVYPSQNGLTVYVHDITQKREEQQELRLLRTAVGRLNDIILITEAEPLGEPGPRIVFVNEAFERRTGFTKNEVMGKTPRILQGTNTQRDRLDKIRKALDAWQPVRTQLINYTKTGEEFWLELDIVPIADEKGWYTHWVAVERDITLQKQTEQQLIQSQKMESLGHITGGIAHDFNNLLTVILGNADLLFENLPEDSPYRPLAETLLNAALKGEKLTTSLLTFSSKQNLIPTKLNVNSLLVNLSTMLNTILGAQHKLNLELAPDLPDINADEAHLESCIINLVINARDAMNNSGAVTITTEYKNIVNLESAHQLEHTHFVSLKVNDTGEGMSKELQQRIFEPFFSTKKPGHGTGLGLSMVFGFARQTGGDILVTSELNKGSTFELLLPCSETDTLEVKSTQTKQVRSKKQWRLLLVEDDAMVRQYALDVLSNEGFNITQAENANEALSIVNSGQQFDIVFTDIVMPGSMDGFELAEQLLKIVPNMPILFTSGYSDNTGQLQKRMAEENGLLRKPYRKAELLLRLDKLLSGTPKQQLENEE